MRQKAVLGDEVLEEERRQVFHYLTGCTRVKTVLGLIDQQAFPVATSRRCFHLRILETSSLSQKLLLTSSGQSTCYFEIVSFWPEIKIHQEVVQSPTFSRECWKLSKPGEHLIDPWRNPSGGDNAAQVGCDSRSNFKSETPWEKQ